MASNLKANLERAISDMDAKMAKIRHRRDELSARLAGLTDDSDPLLREAMAITAASSSVQQKTSCFDAPVAHDSDQVPVDAVVVYNALHFIVDNWGGNDNEVVGVLHRLESLSFDKHVVEYDYQLWFKQRYSEVVALALRSGLTVPWLKTFLK